ncbi:hypothetical protein [Streptomyces anulatus]|uniref:hypothetical protein n=1 Tax=Streptomyces anulatus TaxID=1892 RepID=UPI0036609F96
MTATEFRQTHGDPATWTTADHETYDNLRHLTTPHHVTGGTPAQGKGNTLRNLAHAA